MFNTLILNDFQEDIFVYRICVIKFIMLKELHLLGLSHNEARIYWAVVRLGPLKAGRIITETAIHRNLVYQTLDGLILKGYIAKVSIRGVWQFQITEPGVLLTGLRQREEIAKTVIAEITRHTQVPTRFINIHEGVESYRRYWLKTLGPVDN